MRENVFDQTEALVKCGRCGQTRWVSFADRHAGNRKPPEGVEPSSSARCRSCPTGDDFTRFEGFTRQAKA